MEKTGLKDVHGREIKIGDKVKFYAYGHYWIIKVQKWEAGIYPFVPEVSEKIGFYIKPEQCVIVSPDCEEDMPEGPRMGIKKISNNQKQHKMNEIDKLKIRIADLEQYIFSRHTDKDRAFLKEIQTRLQKWDNNNDIAEKEMVFKMIDDWIDELDEVIKG